MLSSAISRALDRFRGSGTAAVTIPSLDGPLRPNQLLEDASAIHLTEAPDNLVAVGHSMFFTSGTAIFSLQTEGGEVTVAQRSDFGRRIASLAVGEDDAIAVGFAGGEISIGQHDREVARLSAIGGRTPIVCPTALEFVDRKTLLVCLGSQDNGPTDWKRDLLDGNASGSVWLYEIDSGRATCLAKNLAWPHGVVGHSQGRLAVVESWKHRIVELRDGRITPLLSDLPGYPARIIRSQTGGYWLTVFAPRSQLIEFILRERNYRERMMREIDQKFWVAPSLHPAIDYREPLQSGAIKQLGESKAWAPSRSYGLIVRLDDSFEPTDSLHSRANGQRHGITSCVEVGDRLFVSSKGGNVILEVATSAVEGQVE
jgi:hypothetical protein